LPRSGQATDDLRRGEAALKQNDQAAAAQYFQNVLKIEPANVEAHADLGAIAFFQGDCVTAEKNLREALHGSPRLTKALALLSICEGKRGEPQAHDDMEQAFEKLDDVKLRTQLGMEMANDYYQQGDLEKTESILRKMLSISPDNVDVLFFAQRIYSELADNTLNKLAVLSPGSARMEQLIAERLINGGDLKDAIVHYHKALELSPKLPGLHFELAEALLEGSPNSAEAQTEALHELQAAAETDGDSSSIECELGRIALLQSNQTEALSRYERANKMDAGNVQSQIGLAELDRQEGKLEDAATYLRMATKEDPFNAEAHYKLSQIDRELHLNDEQAKELKLFLDIRATRDKVKLLYRQMNPQTAADNAAPSPLQ
jgi:tetratricopeptide (TPR) repeat protein